jgi:hypothetical protein
MRLRLLSIIALGCLSVAVGWSRAEQFVGCFAEPIDGGNLDTALSTYDGDRVTIVPRAHASEAVAGATRWRNVLFAIRGMKGKSPVFELPLISPGNGSRSLSVDVQSWSNIGLVWSYEADPSKWNSFGMHTRIGSGPETWRIQAKNVEPFENDVVYVSINERASVAQFYEWLETKVFGHPRVSPTPSEVKPGTYIIGYQSGAEASPVCSRAIPDMPLFGFVIKDPGAKPTQLVMLFSGQHPYEGQNKVALEAAVDWILNSTTAEAKAYRAHYLTVVYPFVNPTGELAGLWRGTAAQPGKDTNRNWNTEETIPSNVRGIDTVVVHKNALKIDIAALGLGEPYAVFDYHQNFGDRPSEPDYVLHATTSDAADSPLARRVAERTFSPYFARLTASTGVADIDSDLSTQETLRGYMVARGVALPLTFERSVYHTLESERLFGISTVKALVDGASLEGLHLGSSRAVAFNAGVAR